MRFCTLLYFSKSCNPFESGLGKKYLKRDNLCRCILNYIYINVLRCVLK